MKIPIDSNYTDQIKLTHSMAFGIKMQSGLTSGDPHFFFPVHSAIHNVRISYANELQEAGELIRLNIGAI